ncbi:MAG: hypothetical protein ACK518_03515 [bacterium]
MSLAQGPLLLGTRLIWLRFFIVLCLCLPSLPNFAVWMRVQRRSTYPPLDYGTAFAATPQKANQPTRLQLLPHLTKGLRASGGQPGLT